MEIVVHPGPVGQAYYLDDPPSDLAEGREDGLAHFCSSWCTYTYVLEREGAMGQSLIGFSETDDVETFADEYDGELVEYDDITLELLATL